MATITSAASGNWSSGATWVGGVVPTAADDVVIVSGHTVTIDVDITVLSIYNNASTLIVSTSRTITLTGNGLTTNTGFLNSGSGALRITGTVTTVSFSGLISSNEYRAGIELAGNNNTVNVASTGTGRAIATGALIQSVLIVTGNTNTVTYTGNLLNVGTYNGLAIGLISNTGTGNIINFVGTANNGLYPSFLNTQTLGCTFNINGILNKSSIPVCYDLQNASAWNFTGTVSGTQTDNPFFVRKLNISAVSSWQFSSSTLYTPGVAIGNPATTDVRNGVTYASGALTGTLVVPSPSNVRQGVPTDNTVGTAALTPADFWDYLTSGATPGSMGARVAAIPTNPASVESTGAQIASFNT